MVHRSGVLPSNKWCIIICTPANHWGVLTSPIIKTGQYQPLDLPKWVETSTLQCLTWSYALGALCSLLCMYRYIMLLLSMPFCWTAKIYPKLFPFQHRNHILYLVESYQTVVIVGETGCGKSTQIPQVGMWLRWWLIWEGTALCRNNALDLSSGKMLETKASVISSMIRNVCAKINPNWWYLVFT